MSNSSSGPSPLKIAGFAFAGLAALGTLYVVGLIIYAIYLFINRNNPSVLPPTDAWWWPSSMNKYLHNYPRGYVMKSNVTLSTSSFSNVYSNVTASGCKKKCEATSDDCIGFELNLASNTCTTYASIGFPIEYTGNNLYIVEGNEPGFEYATYKSNVADSYTATSNILSYISTNYIDCSSNCTSNVTCLGFEYNSTTNECKQRTDFKKSNLVQNASFTSYIIQQSSFSPSPV